MAKRPPRRRAPAAPPYPLPPSIATLQPPVPALSRQPPVAALATRANGAPRRSLELGGPAVGLDLPDPEALRRATTDAPAPTEGEQAQLDDEQRKRTLHKDALDRFKLADNAEKPQRTRELDDLNFELDQWPKEYRTEREGGIAPDGHLIPSRPCLQIDKLDQPIQQVLNEARQSKLAIQIKAKGNGASKRVAEIRQGLIRAIETESRAQIARNWALDRATKCGRGAYQIKKRYANDGDNDLDLIIARILNQHTVYLDPFAIEPDWSDGEWGFITTDLPENEYKRRYPKSALAQMMSDQLKGLGDQSPGWISGEEGAKAYRVAEHYYVVHKDRTRVFVQGLGWKWRDELSADQVAIIKPGSDRTVDVREVKWCLLNAAEIMDEEEWEGRYIPIIPVIGKEYNVNGTRVWKGIISNAKDAQRSYNVMRSRQLESIGLASLSTWVMAEGQDEGYEEQWDRANTSAFVRLIYKPTTVDGLLAPAPHRDTAEPAIMAITQAVREADGDIKATTGRFDPSLGRNNSSDRSGKAINALKAQGESGTSNYLENLASISMVYEGKVLNDMLEYVYDRPGRVVRIIGEEDEEIEVMLNHPYRESDEEDGGPVPLGPDEPHNPQDESQKFFNLKDGGQYRVTVAIGPSAPTQAEADKDFMSDIATAAPDLVPVFADLWIRASGSKAANQIADRIKRQSPYAKGEDEQKKSKVPPEVQQAMQQMDQQLKMAAAKVQEQQQIIDTEQTKAAVAFKSKQAELASRERIAKAEILKDLIIKKAELMAQAGTALLDAEIGRLEAEQQQASDHADRQHALTTQAADHAHEQQLSAQQLAAQQRQAETAAAAAPTNGGGA